MKKKKKDGFTEYGLETYVQFFRYFFSIKGSMYLFDTSLIQKIEGANGRDPSKVIIPDNCMGFRFLDRVVAYADINGKQIKLESDLINESPKYYNSKYIGKIYSASEIDSTTAEIAGPEQEEARKRVLKMINEDGITRFIKIGSVSYPLDESGIII